LDGNALRTRHGDCTEDSNHNQAKTFHDPRPNCARPNPINTTLTRKRPVTQAGAVRIGLQTFQALLTTLLESPGSEPPIEVAHLARSRDHLAYLATARPSAAQSIEAAR
jgi:hypothetical protein